METFSAKMYHVLKSAQGDFNQGNVHFLEIQQVKNVHAMHYFHCAG